MCVCMCVCMYIYIYIYIYMACELVKEFVNDSSEKE